MKRCWEEKPSKRREASVLHITLRHEHTAAVGGRTPDAESVRWYQKAAESQAAWAQVMIL